MLRGTKRVKFASINIERSHHLKERVLPFLQREQPEVLCLQELCARDIEVFEDIFGQPLLYAPLCLHPYPNIQDNEWEPIGVGLISCQALKATDTHYYNLEYRTAMPKIVFTTRPGGQFIPDLNTVGQAVVSASVAGIRFMTTHLVVTPKGESTDYQLTLADKLIVHSQGMAERYNNALLCGDFNAPRGRTTWAKLAEAFVDNIPAHYTTSLDGELHRAGPLPYMVDGAFSKGNLQVNHVQLHTGVSDHCAITGEVELI